MVAWALIPILSGSAVSGPSAVQPAPNAARPSWIFFRDRGDLARPGRAREAALAEASRRITPRAAARRAKAARERDRLASRGAAAPPDPGALLDAPPDPGALRDDSD